MRTVPWAWSSPTCDGAQRGPGEAAQGAGPAPGSAPALLCFPPSSISRPPSSPSLFHLHPSLISIPLPSPSFLHLPPSPTSPSPSSSTSIPSLAGTCWRIAKTESNGCKTGSPKATSSQTGGSSPRPATSIPKSQQCMRGWLGCGEQPLWPRGTPAMGWRDPGAGPQGHVWVFTLPGAASVLAGPVPLIPHKFNITQLHFIRASREM